MKKGRPATGRNRHHKLHLWISDEASSLLARYCASFRCTKTHAIEHLLSGVRNCVMAAEQDER